MATLRTVCGSISGEGLDKVMYDTTWYGTPPKKGLDDWHEDFGAGCVLHGWMAVRFLLHYHRHHHHLVREFRVVPHNFAQWVLGDHNGGPGCIKISEHVLKMFRNVCLSQKRCSLIIKMKRLDFYDPPPGPSPKTFRDPGVPKIHKFDVKKDILCRKVVA